MWHGRAARAEVKVFAGFELQPPGNYHHYYDSDDDVDDDDADHDHDYDDNDNKINQKEAGEESEEGDDEPASH